MSEAYGKVRTQSKAHGKHPRRFAKEEQERWPPQDSPSGPALVIHQCEGSWVDKGIGLLAAGPRMCADLSVRGNCRIRAMGGPPSLSWHPLVTCTASLQTKSSRRPEEMGCVLQFSKKNRRGPWRDGEYPG